MCGPMMMMIGGAVSAASSIMQGQQAAANAKAQAAFNYRQSRLEYVKGTYDDYRKAEEGKKIQGSQRAGYVASGLELGGTPTETITETGKQVHLDRQAILFGRDIAASNYKYKGDINMMEAKQATAGGFIGAVTSIVNVGTKLNFGSSFA